MHALTAEYGFIYPVNSWLVYLTQGVGRTQEFYTAGERTGWYWMRERLGYFLGIRSSLQSQCAEKHVCRQGELGCPAGTSSVEGLIPRKEIICKSFDVLKNPTFHSSLSPQLLKEEILDDPGWVGRFLSPNLPSHSAKKS